RAADAPGSTAGAGAETGGAVARLPHDPRPAGRAEGSEEPAVTTTSPPSRQTHRPRRMFTAGQAAAMLQTSPRTVQKWFDAREFPTSYRLPGSLDRRITAVDLRDFCRRHRLPLPRELRPGGLLMLGNYCFV